MRTSLLLTGLLVAGCGSGSSTVHDTSATTSTVVVTTTNVTATTKATSPTPATTTPATTTRPVGSSSPAIGRSGVRGTVTAGPTCPVERVGDPCPPRPVQTGLRLVTAAGVVVASGASGGDGAFSITAPPGSYNLEAVPGNGPFPRCPAVPVTVAAGAYTAVNMVCDTGIR